jgi:hypothetical protein
VAGGENMRRLNGEKTASAQRQRGQPGWRKSKNQWRNGGKIGENENARAASKKVDDASWLAKMST